MILPDENGYSPNYQAIWSRRTPGLIVFMIDQSASMSQIGAGGEIIAEKVTRLINNTIEMLCVFNDFHGDLMYIAIVGYGRMEGTNIIRSGWLHSYSEDCAKGTSTEQCVIPVYDGVPDMTEAFKLVSDLVLTWIEVRRKEKCAFHCPVPLILNFTKGVNIGDDNEMVTICNSIKQIALDDGHPLIYNFLFPTHSFFKTLEFPIKEQFYGDLDEYNSIWETASTFPESLIDEFTEYGCYSIVKSSRSIIVNPTRIPIVNHIHTL